MSAQPTASEQIIHVVDDDEALRDSMTWMLEGNNYKVATYDSADAFLRVISPVMVGCVVLDVRMPGMSGLELFEELGRRGCSLPVVFITGHGDVLGISIKTVEVHRARVMEKMGVNSLAELVQHVVTVDPDKVLR